MKKQHNKREKSIPPEDFSKLALISLENLRGGEVPDAVLQSLESSSARRVATALIGGQTQDKDTKDTADYIVEWASRTP